MTPSLPRYRFGCKFLDWTIAECYTEGENRLCQSEALRLYAGYSCRKDGAFSFWFAKGKIDPRLGRNEQPMAIWM